MKLKILLLFGLALVFISASHLSLRSAPPKEPLLLPPQYLEYFTFGQKDLVADLLWIRAIQDFDFCGDEMTSEQTAAESLKKVKVCSKGWVFSMLDAATRIAPRYKIIYTRGAINLSVLVNDKEGANVLLDRGIANFPKDWYIYYHSGYHNLFETKNLAKAAESFRLCGLHGGPAWITVLAARVFNDAGKSEMGMRALQLFYHDIPFDEWPSRAQDRFHELEAKLKSSGP